MPIIPLSIFRLEFTSMRNQTSPILPKDSFYLLYLSTFKSHLAPYVPAPPQNDRRNKC